MLVTRCASQSGRAKEDTLRPVPLLTMLVRCQPLATVLCSTLCVTPGTLPCPHSSRTRPWHLPYYIVSPKAKWMHNGVSFTAWSVCGTHVMDRRWLMRKERCQSPLFGTTVCIYALNPSIAHKLVHARSMPAGVSTSPSTKHL